jgi:hypothetical protein
VTLALTPDRHPLPTISLAQLLSGEGANANAGLWPVRRTAGQYCGYDLFAVVRPGSFVKVEAPVSEGGGGLNVPPFDHADVLARPGHSDGYDRVVTCTRSFGSPYPWCSSLSDYDGWRMLIHFSGEHLCTLDQVISRSRALLDGFVAAKTEVKGGKTGE